jgi:hypothetical protein
MMIPYSQQQTAHNHAQNICGMPEMAWNSIPKDVARTEQTTAFSVVHPITSHDKWGNRHVGFNAFDVCYTANVFLSSRFP